MAWLDHGAIQDYFILLVMLFLHALHSRYSNILDQFRSWYKVLEMATNNSVAYNVHYHIGFQLVGLEKRPLVLVLSKRLWQLLPMWTNRVPYVPLLLSGFPATGQMALK
jgi:hypothetical protein